MVAKRPYPSSPRWRQSRTTTTKTASLARARAPTTSMLLRRVRDASRSLTARIVVEFSRRFASRHAELSDGLYRLTERMLRHAIAACLLVVVLSACGAGTPASG